MKKFFTFWALTFAMLAVALWASVFGSLAYVLSIFGLITPVENAAKGIFLIAHDFFTWAEKYHYGVKLDAKPKQNPADFLTSEEKKIAEWVNLVEAVNAESQRRWEARKKNKQFLFSVVSGKEVIFSKNIIEHCEHCAVVAGIEITVAEQIDVNLTEVSYHAKEVTP